LGAPLTLNAGGLAAGFAFGLTVGFAVRFAAGLAFGLAAGLALGAALGLTAGDVTYARPASRIAVPLYGELSAGWPSWS